LAAAAGCGGSFLGGAGDEQAASVRHAAAVKTAAWNLRIALQYGMLRESLTMPAYDEFAWFYKRYWNEDFHSLAFPILERIWLERVPRGGSVLDVCCGTGYLAGLLTGAGFQVTGIDLSAPMIEHARAAVAGASFQVCDAAGFHLPPVFDAAVSTFDSLNHILELKSLRSAFRNVAGALKPGATFAFDVLLQEAYQTHWGESYALVRDDHVLTITGAAYDFRTRVARCTVTMFRLVDGAWIRHDAEIAERCYTPAQIDGALADAGFGEILCYAAEDLGMGGQLGEGRTFYVATRL
jgi:SAM-dependent methyltransferase